MAANTPLKELDGNKNINRKYFTWFYNYINYRCNIYFISLPSEPFIISKKDKHEKMPHSISPLWAHMIFCYTYTIPCFLKWLTTFLSNKLLQLKVMINIEINVCSNLVVLGILGICSTFVFYSERKKEWGKRNIFNRYSLYNILLAHYIIIQMPSTAWELLPKCCYIRSTCYASNISFWCILYLILLQ